LTKNAAGKFLTQDYNALHTQHTKLVREMDVLKQQYATSAAVETATQTQGREQDKDSFDERSAKRKKITHSDESVPSAAPLTFLTSAPTSAELPTPAPPHIVAPSGAVSTHVSATGTSSRLKMLRTQLPSLHDITFLVYSYCAGMTTCDVATTGVSLGKQNEEEMRQRDCDTATPKHSDTTRSNSSGVSSASISRMQSSPLDTVSSSIDGKRSGKWARVWPTAFALRSASQTTDDASSLLQGLLHAMLDAHQALLKLVEREEATTTEEQEELEDAVEVDGLHVWFHSLLALARFLLAQLSISTSAATGSAASIYKGMAALREVVFTIADVIDITARTAAIGEFAAKKYSRCVTGSRTDKDVGLTWTNRNLAHKFAAADIASVGAAKTAGAESSAVPPVVSPWSSIFLPALMTPLHVTGSATGNVADVASEKLLHSAWLASLTYPIASIAASHGHVTSYACNILKSMQSSSIELLHNVCLCIEVLPPISSTRTQTNTHGALYEGYKVEPVETALVVLLNSCYNAQCSNESNRGMGVVNSNDALDENDEEGYEEDELFLPLLESPSAHTTQSGDNSDLHTNSTWPHPNVADGLGYNTGTNTDGNDDIDPNGNQSLPSAPPLLILLQRLSHLPCTSRLLLSILEGILCDSNNHEPNGTGKMISNQSFRALVTGSVSRSSTSVGSCVSGSSNINCNGVDGKKNGLISKTGAHFRGAPLKGGKLAPAQQVQSAAVSPVTGVARRENVFSMWMSALLQPFYGHDLVTSTSLGTQTTSIDGILSIGTTAVSPVHSKQKRSPDLSARTDTSCRVNGAFSHEYRVEREREIIRLQLRTVQFLLSLLRSHQHSFAYILLMEGCVSDNEIRSGGGASARAGGGSGSGGGSGGVATIVPTFLHLHTQTSRTAPTAQAYPINDSHRSGTDNALYLPTPTSVILLVDYWTTLVRSFDSAAPLLVPNSLLHYQAQLAVALTKLLNEIAR